MLTHRALIANHRQVDQVEPAIVSQGDVVLLAPAAASMDMFVNYGARGDAFAEAVLRRAASGE